MPSRAAVLPFLSRVFENGGNLVVQEVATQPLTQDLLHSSVILFHPSNVFLRHTLRGARSLLPVPLCLTGLLHRGPGRLERDGVEGKTSFQGGAAGSPQQGAGEFTSKGSTYQAL